MFDFLRSLVGLRRSPIGASRRREGSKDNAAIFGAIYRDKRWGGDSKVDFYSGSGNAPEMIASYISGVRTFLSKLGPSVIVDIGCGDFVAGAQLVDLASRYIACDVVPELIDRNRGKFVHDNLEFLVIDATKDKLPPGDVVVVKQVLQHLSNDQIHRIVDKLRRYKTWIICDYVPANKFIPNKDMMTGMDVRTDSGVVLTESPFSIEPNSTEVLSTVEWAQGTPNHGIIQTLAYKFT
jgi:SAM-dependent methyltransferase